LAKNFKAKAKGKDLKSFKYKDLGTMATIGRKNYKYIEVAQSIGGKEQSLSYRETLPSYCY